MVVSVAVFVVNPQSAFTVKSLVTQFAVDFRDFFMDSLFVLFQALYVGVIFATLAAFGLVVSGSVVSVKLQ